MIRSRCPHCHAKLSAPDSHSGKGGICTGCMHKFTWPAGEETAALPVSVRKRSGRRDWLIVGAVACLVCLVVSAGVAVWLLWDSSAKEQRDARKQKALHAVEIDEAVAKIDRDCEKAEIDFALLRREIDDGLEKYEAMKGKQARTMLRQAIIRDVCALMVSVERIKTLLARRIDLVGDRGNDGARIELGRKIAAAMQIAIDKLNNEHD